MFNQSNEKNKYFSLVFVITILIFISCGFAFKKHILGQYYLVGVDSKSDVTVCFKLATGDFIGKIPHTLIEYGYNDSFLVGKSKEYNKNFVTYYIIDMRKDSEFAHEKNFRIGPINQVEFDSIWRKRLNIRMISVN